MRIDFKQYIINTRVEIHEWFTGHPLFGPIVFILLTVSLLLPPFGGASTDAVKYAALLIGLALLLWSVKRTQVVEFRPWIFWWAVAWSIWVSITVLMSRDWLYALIGNYPRYNSSWFVYVGFAALLLSCVALGKRYEKALIYLLVFCSVCIAVFGILQVYGIGFYNSAPGAFLDRVPSLIGNPNFSSWFIAAVLPFGYVGIVKSEKFVVRLGWGVFLFIGAWSIALFASRGAVLGLCAGMAVVGVVVLLLRRWRSFFIFCIIAVCTGLLLFAYYRVYRTPVVPSASNSVVDASASDRFAAWYIAGEVWSAHKVFGIGPGNFDQYYWKDLPSTFMGGAQYFDDAHNVLLVLLSDMGTPGFILFGSLTGMVAAAALMQLRAKRQEMGWWLAAASGVVVWLVASLFNPAVISLWVLLAVLCAITFFYATPFRTHTVTLGLPRRLVSLGLGLLCLVLAVGIVVGEYTLVYIIALEPYRSRSPQVLSEQYTLARRARVIEPYNLETRFAAVATHVALNKDLQWARKETDQTFSLHPYSARAALLASQIYTEIWMRSHEATDAQRATTYVETALLRSTGYPVTYSWAAYLYWVTGNVELSERYTHIAVTKQPNYYYNWLLLAKHYREHGNLRGMEWALGRAQRILPNDTQLARLRRQLAETKDPRAIDIHPAEPSVLTRLH